MTAELFFGTTLWLPSEFFESSLDINEINYTSHIKRTVQEAQVIPMPSSQQSMVHIRKDLADCTHAFVRHDTLRGDIPFLHCNFVTS